MAWPPMLELSERQVRVAAPFIGGGFGPKIIRFYPEEVLLPWLAIQFERSVKWIEDRAEHFLATTQARFPIVAEILRGKGGNHSGPLSDPRQINRTAACGAFELLVAPTPMPLSHIRQCAGRELVGYAISRSYCHLARETLLAGSRFRQGGYN
jgi:CO/xanthine dehydrogenase Mo-binding subunit